MTYFIISKICIEIACDWFLEMFSSMLYLSGTTESPKLRGTSYYKTWKRMPKHLRNIELAFLYFLN